MDVPLNPLQTALATSRLEIDNRLRLEIEKFERYAARKKARLERERANSKAVMFRALAESLGAPSIAPGATLGLRADGVGVLVLPDPPKPPAKALTSEPTGEDLHEHGGDAPLAPITSMPAANGAIAGANPR